jgi:hypothetical protein
MPVREFLRGGYQKISEPTVVTSHGHVLFTVWPGVRDYRSDAQRATLREGPPGPSPNGG